MSREDWLQHRMKGIGCSEIAAVMGLNRKYQSSLELFYNKLGEVEPMPDNAATFMGRFLEDKVADLYQYWETDFDTTMANYTAGEKINKLQRVNAILTNPEHPFLLG